MFPHPLLTISLVIMWLLLNGFTLGHLILGSLVAVCASWGMAALRPATPTMRNWHLLPKLLIVVFYDIIKSNLAVAWIILRSGRPKHNPGFLKVPLDVQSPFSLALLAVILTSTPGSAWLEYDSNDNSVLLHVLDLDDEAKWREIVKNRYEALLLEIFA